MPSNGILTLSFLFSCVALHFFNGVGLFYSHPFPEGPNTFNDQTLDFSEISTKISFLTRIAGGYYLGKLADGIGFTKTMKIICLMYVFVGLILVFYNMQIIPESTILLCLAHGIISFLRWSCFVLPITYIFQNYDKAKRHQYSAIGWTAAVSGIMLSNFFAIIFTNTQPINWCIAYAISGILGFIIYNHIGSLPKSEKKQTTEEPISKEAIVLAFLLAGICGVGLSYQYFFIEHYFSNVMILDTPGQQVIFSPFWITLFFTFIPAAQITKNFKTIKIIQMSLLGILLSVALFYIFPFFNNFILFIHQVIFAIAFGLFLSPALRFIYRLLHGYNSYFYMNFIFCLGISCFKLLGGYLAKSKFLPTPLLGTILITLLMTISIILSYRFGLALKVNAKKTIQDSSEEYSQFST